MTTLNCYYMSAAVLCVVIIYNSVILSLISCFIFNSIYHFGRSEVQRVHSAGFPSETFRLPV